MKTKLLKLFTVAGWITIQCSLSVKAQTVSTVETVTLSPNSHWDGASMPLGTTFNSGNAIFQNYYDTSYSGYWSKGWAYTNETDSITPGYHNLYSARPASGYGNSANYVVGKGGAIINLNSTARGKMVSGFYVTNGTFAALSMKDGDSPSRKFGDTTGTGSSAGQGNYPDWFKLTVRKWLGGVLTNDSVEFYLADYRFSNNTQDYIVKTWEWVDLSVLGNVDSLKFELHSSDVGAYGMNTPGYFCMDNFTTANIGVSVQEINSENPSFSMYPNPVKEILNLDLSKLTDKNMQLTISDVAGQVIYFRKITSSNLISIDLEGYSNGMYLVNLTGENTFINEKLIKE